MTDPLTPEVENADEPEVPEAEAEEEIPEEVPEVLTKAERDKFEASVRKAVRKIGETKANIDVIVQEAVAEALKSQAPPQTAAQGTSTFSRYSALSQLDPAVQSELAQAIEDIATQAATSRVAPLMKAQEAAEMEAFDKQLKSFAKENSLDEDELLETLRDLYDAPPSVARLPKALQAAKRELQGSDEEALRERIKAELLAELSEQAGGKPKVKKAGSAPEKDPDEELESMEVDELAKGLGM